MQYGLLMGVIVVIAFKVLDLVIDSIDERLHPTPKGGWPKYDRTDI